MFKRIFVTIHAVPLWAFILLAGVLSACQTMPREHGSQLLSQPSHVLEEADQYFDRGQYKTALVKYSSYIYAPFPNQTKLDHARYRMALCHYKLEQYAEAHESFYVLLKERPDFAQADEAKIFLEESKEKVKKRQEKLKERREELDFQIVQLKELLKKDPENAEYHYKLANSFWEVGLIKEAVEQYELAATLNQNYLQKETLRRRIRIKDSGEFAVRDPNLDFAKDDTVVVEHVNKKIVRKGDWLGERDYVRISGFVRNKGLRNVRNVSVEVTIYDFNNNVQDIEIYRIGRLRAGDRREFAVTMDEFTGWAEDVRDYGITVYYDE
ncbi:tetratricopeptide repeat protein [bacterium]|nr:tetratricopeptide repeat protein [bacterium]